MKRNPRYCYFITKDDPNAIDLLTLPYTTMSEVPYSLRTGSQDISFHFKYIVFGLFINGIRWFLQISFLYH